MFASVSVSVCLVHTSFFLPIVWMIFRTFWKGSAFGQRTVYYTVGGVLCIRVSRIKNTKNHTAKVCAGVGIYTRFLTCRYAAPLSYRSYASNNVSNNNNNDNEHICIAQNNKNSSGDEIANVNFLRPLNDFLISTKDLRYTYLRGLARPTRRGAQWTRPLLQETHQETWA